MIKLIEGIALKDLENLVWMDLEFTGLEDDHVIIELACLITDKHLNVIAEGPHLVIQRTEGELANIDDWPLKVHTKSGLLEKVKTDIVFFQAGVDSLDTDALGHMKLSHQGLKKRNTMILEFCKSRNYPILVFMGGGYSKPINDTVKAFKQLFLQCSKYNEH